jgi:hypothetical protein
MANRSWGGFRYRGNLTAPGAVEPRIEIVPVATGYATALYYGDPVKLATDGTLQAAAAGDRLFGVFVGAEQYWDGTVKRKGLSIPAGVAWGTNVDRQTKARVIKATPGIYWELDADDGVTATTQAAHEAFIGENCEWVAGAATGEYSGAALDISTHATTATLSLRIVDIPNRDQQDFASSRVKYYVEINLANYPAGTATGT